VSTDQLTDRPAPSTGGRAAVTVRNLRIETNNGVAVVPDALSSAP
jgi:hypothetical protein